MESANVEECLDDLDWLCTTLLLWLIDQQLIALHCLTARTAIDFPSDSSCNYGNVSHLSGCMEIVNKITVTTAKCTLS